MKYKFKDQKPLENQAVFCYNVSMERLLNFDHIVSGDKIAVALSGGRDSVALLYALLSCAGARGYEVVAIHVNHGIRGQEALRDEQFCKDLCQRLCVPLHVERVDVPGAMARYGSMEQTARALRYDVFERQVAAGFCNKVATAHHAGDNAETVLMRALRGTGLNGLAGIRCARGVFIRPMLGATRRDVDAYISAKGLEFREDSTNSCSDIARNFIRNEIMPSLCARFDGVEENLVRTAQLAKEADDFIRDAARDLVRMDGDAAVICQTDSPILTKYAVKMAAEMLGVFADIEQRHLEIAVQAMKGQKGVFDMPNGLKLEREEGGLSLYFPRTTNGEIPCRLGENVLDGRTIVIEETDGVKKGELCFCTDLGTTVLRGRKGGDSFHRFGGGRKSLGDWFTDTKTPLRQRDSAVLLARGNDVLVVVGREIADSVKIDNNSQKIYTIKEKKL